MLTGLYVILVPLILTIAIGGLTFYLFFAAPLFVAAAVFLYSYFIIGKSKLKKPDTMSGLYKPVLYYLGWQLFLTITFNLFVRDHYGVLMMGLLSLNPFVLIGLDDWRIAQLGIWIYNLGILGGFTAGERLAAHRTSAVREPFERKKMRIRLVCIAAMLLISEGVWFYKRRNIIAYEPGREGYGFAYENGYSSTDLEPYYVENDENILAKLAAPSDFIISDPQKMPVLDGAEAAYPIYSAFANACYENIDKIQAHAKENNNYKNQEYAKTKNQYGNQAADVVYMPIQFNNSVVAFESLVKGEVDIFFGAKPSESQRDMADAAGKGLVLTPIGKEAFIFFVNSENPVDGLISEQIRDIYSDRIRNWKKVGGKNEKILAFQRPENSGSQTMMEYFMGDAKLKEPLETEYESSMSGLLQRTASYRNSSAAIGYSFRYFASIMASDMEIDSRIKYLKVDGVYPDADTIRSGEYPITTELYAITLLDNSNENVSQFLEWMAGAQGQQIVADTGYVALY